MDTIDHIRVSLSEIDILLDYASRNSANIHKYQLFNKVSIVLLSTKFEVFLEEFIEEHSTRMLNGHTNATLPSKLKEAYFDRGIGLIVNEKKKSIKDALFNSLSILQQNRGDSITILQNIKPSTSFNYGKHGQKEIEALFKRHGLEDFIKSDDAQNCLSILNSLIAIRNNVIHQDASPGITHQTIIEHKNNILNFLNSLESNIESKKSAYYNE